MYSRRLFIGHAVNGVAILTAGCAGAQGIRFNSRSEALDMSIDWEYLEQAQILTRESPTVDVHAHPGRFFLGGPDDNSEFNERYGAPFPARVISAMGVGDVGAAVCSAVADYPILAFSPQGLRSIRDYQPGEVVRDYQRQVGALKGLVAPDLGMPGLSLNDINNAHAEGRTACIFAIEGGDFIEDRLERVSACHAEGVRSIAIIHYHTNQIGDPQTSEPVHGGLTRIGRDVVRELNDFGILIDLAHASYDATRQAVDISTRPMMISHSNLQAPGLRHPRLISTEHAKLVTESGGIIGALCAGEGQGTFSDYVDTILRTVDTIGIDHVSISTDMDFTFRSVLSDYRDWQLLPAALLSRGMHAEEVSKVLGRNFLRVFAAATNSA